MTLRSIEIKKIVNASEKVQIEDSEASIIEMYYKTETLIKSFQEAQKDDSEKKVKISADFRKEFHSAKDNNHRVMKQVRQYQRNQNIFFSADKTLTHYVYAHRKMKLTTKDSTELVNHVVIYHLYSAKIELSETDFTALLAFIAAKK